MKDVMIDFETFGTGAKALVCQIGACYFDRKTGELGQSFKRNVDVQEMQKLGFEIEASTVLWWLQQSAEARTSLANGFKTSPLSAFTALNEFLKDAEQIWSHATFDYVILNETLKHLNIKASYSFRSARDIRTLLDLVEFKKEDYPVRSGTHHDAYDDCIYQIEYVVKALNKIRGS